MQTEIVDSIRGTAVRQITGTNIFFWIAGLTIDADGSPRAYAPGNHGLDFLGNAGTPGNWWGLACDPKTGRPFVQDLHDPAPGYYVSTTALEDPDKAPRDPARYVDSERVPFIVIPGHLNAPIHMGDFATAVNLNLASRPVVHAIVPEAGELGVMTVVLSRDAGSGNNFSFEGEAQPVYETTWFEVQKDVVRHPRYQGGGDDAIPDADFKAIKFAREGKQDYIDYLEGLDGANPAKKVWKKILAGNDDYIEFIPIISSTQHFFAYPASVNGGAGYRNQPPEEAGPPAGWQWLKTSDELTRTGYRWVLKRQWTGAVKIDTDLYGAR